MGFFKFDFKLPGTVDSRFFVKCIMDLDSYWKEILNTWLLRDYFYLDASTYCLQELNSNYGHTFGIVYICISKRNVNIYFIEILDPMDFVV